MTQENKFIQPRQYTVATINTEQQTSSSVHTPQRQLIPVNFVQLESQQENNIGSAGRFGKPGYERYLFSYRGGYFYFDLSFELLEQLGLVSGQNCEHTIYISQEALNRNQERGGITINSSEDVILVRPGTILEREVQTDLSNQVIDQRINALQEANTQLEINQGRLTQENNNLQTDLVTEQETNQNLQTQSFLLQALIINLQNQVANLTIERDNRPNTSRENYNNLIAGRNTFRNRYLNTHGIVNNAQVALGIDDLNHLPVLPQGENLNSLLNRPTREQLNQIEQEKERLEQEKQELQTQLDLATKTKEGFLKQLNIYRKYPVYYLNEDEDQEIMFEILKNHRGLSNNEIPVVLIHGYDYQETVRNTIDLQSENSSDTPFLKEFKRRIKYLDSFILKVEKSASRQYIHLPAKNTPFYSRVVSRYRSVKYIYNYYDFIDAPTVLVGTTASARNIPQEHPETSGDTLIVPV